jgi:CRP-like cAMP-binding protein
MNSLTDTILASPLGKDLTQPEAEALSKLVSVRDLADGEVLVTEGSRDNHLHVILSGRIAVARRTDAGWNFLHTLGAGDLVGELSFMHDEARYASLLASGATRVLVLSRPDFEHLIDQQPRAVYKIMRSIMRVAHEVQTRLSRQMFDLQNYLYRPGAKY